MLDDWVTHLGGAEEGEHRGGLRVGLQNLHRPRTPAAQVSRVWPDDNARGAPLRGLLGLLGEGAQLKAAPRLAGKKASVLLTATTLTGMLVRARAESPYL